LKKCGTPENRILSTDFENLLVSSGVYVSSNMYNPDGEEVYGSLADYYWIMSDHNLIVSGFVVNTVGAGNIPNWIHLGHTKAEYASGAYGIFSDAIDLARAHGLDVDGLGEFVKLVIIYAGNIHYGDALNPQAVGTMYIMSERNGPANQENGNDPFGRIGVHCHEFAHTLGIGHSSGSRSDLMQDGRRNGPVSTGSNGSAPAPLNPQHRAQKGWISPIVISGQEQWDAHYSLTTPEVFRINSNTSGDYFLIENRRFDQYMVIGSTSVRDYNYWMPICWTQNPTWQFYSQGIIVWRIIGGDPGWYDTNGLVYASGRYDMHIPTIRPLKLTPETCSPAPQISPRCLHGQTHAILMSTLMMKLLSIIRCVSQTQKVGQTWECVC
jgi:M6 family metalloprotease-like protein